MSNSIIEAQLTLAEEKNKLQGKITIDISLNLPLDVYANIRDERDMHRAIFEQHEALFEAILGIR